MLAPLIQAFAKLFRALPDFRGKYRISAKVHQVVIKNKLYTNPLVWVGMKQGFDLLIDLRSQTHASAFWRGMYDTDLVKKITSLFEEDWVVIDVGANIGYYTIPFAKKLSRLKGLVYAFEPLRENYNHLNLSLEKNKCTHYEAYQLGLGAKREIIGISSREEGVTGNAVLLKQTLKAKLDYQESEKVKIVPLDQFIKEKNPERCDFIKLDIEGFEIDFMYGAKDTMKKYRPVVYGEFSNFYIELYDQDMKDVWRLCRDLSYSIYAPINKRDLTRFSKVVEYRPDLEDILLLPDELSKDKIACWIN